MEKNSRQVGDIGRYVRARREATSIDAIEHISSRRRHVQHLTQSDLAELIGMSTVVISQIEQGRYPNLSRTILHRISESLALTQQQHTYLLGLFDKRPLSQRSPGPSPEWLTTSLNHIGHPAMVLNPGYDIVAINEKGKGFFGGINAEFSPNRNAAEVVFTLPAFKEFVPEWHQYAITVVSGIKINYAIFPAWRDYIDTVSKDLSNLSDLFAERWGLDDPLVTPTIEKVFHHPELGILNVRQILTDIIEAPGLTRVEIIPADDETRQKFGRL